MPVYEGVHDKSLTHQQLWKQFSVEFPLAAAQRTPQVARNKLDCQVALHLGQANLQMVKSLNPECQKLSKQHRVLETITNRLRVNAKPEMES